MSTVGRRLAIVAVVASAGVLLVGTPALAKGLPVDSVVVETAQPQVGQPVDVVVRFGHNFDLGDYAWENVEVSVLPAARTDSRGWPLDRNEGGIPIKLHRVGKGTYRGSFVVLSRGDYVVVDWSSVYAKEDGAAGVVVTRTYPMPIKMRVGGARAPGSGVAARAHTSDSKTPFVVGVVVVAAALFLLRRRRRRASPAAPAAVEDRVVVGGAR